MCHRFSTWCCLPRAWDLISSYLYRCYEEQSLLFQLPHSLSWDRPVYHQIVFILWRWFLFLPPLPFGQLWKAPNRCFWLWGHLPSLSFSSSRWSRDPCHLYNRPSMYQNTHCFFPSADRSHGVYHFKKYQRNHKIPFSCRNEAVHDHDTLDFEFSLYNRSAAPHIW